jgi:Flp pilus assembly pilin Flp
MKLWREETGQDLVEYVLLVSLIALAVALAFPPVATAMAAVFNSVAAALGGGGGGGAP